METPETVLPCAEKLGFDTRKEAEGAAVVAGWRHGNKLNAYKCHHCQLWHLATN